MMEPKGNTVRKVVKWKSDIVSERSNSYYGGSFIDS
jgi:hypothetical protein